MRYLRIATLCFLLATLARLAYAASEAAATAAATTAGAAQTAPADTAVLTRGLLPGSRVLKVFDFEEKALGNFEETPMFWNKVAGRGYPLYTGGKFDHSVYRSKTTSFRLQLDGGSVAYQLQPGRFPVTPNADYYIVGFVKTTALQHAKAEIAAWFAGADGKLIPATESHSEHWASATGKDDWTLLHLFMPGTELAARSLVLQVGLLQPQQVSDRHLSKFELYQQDIQGTAWFDDIIVFQLPRLSITSPAVGGIVAPNQKAVLDLVVSDLGRDKLTAALTVADAAGTVVHQDKSPIAPAPDKPWTRRVDLGLLPPACYTATLDVYDARGLITRRQTRFLATAAVGLSPHLATEFGLDASAWPVDAWGELPAILGQAGTGLTKLPAWRRETSEESLLRKDQPFDQLINALQRQDVSTIASFSEIPSALTTRVNEQSDSVLALLDVDVNLWRPYVSFILARYAQRVDLWQLGQTRDAFYSGDPRYAKVYAKTKAELDVLLTGPKLVIPWNAMYDFDPKAFPGAILDLRLPSAIRPPQLPLYIQSFTDNKVQVLALVEPLEEGRYARIARLNDFAQRIIWARSANPRAVLIDLPVTRQATLTECTSQPDELLLVYRTIVRELGGTIYKGELALHPGVRAFLFDRQGVGTLVLWNENGTEPNARIALALGRSPSTVDLLGRATPLAVKDGVSELVVTAAPLIVENIDSRLAELRGSFGLDVKTIPAGVGVLETRVHLRNPYDTPISGSLHLWAPEGWTIDPPSFPVSVAAGGKLDQAVTIRYPFAAFAGPKVIRGRLTLDNEARALDLLTHVELASDQVEMECLAHAARSGELVLQQMITNTSNTALNAQAYVMVPGLARQQRFVLDLQPGQTVIKRFMFPNAAALEGKAAAVGLRRADGRTLIAKAVPLN